jgi:hypothetical protein
VTGDGGISFKVKSAKPNERLKEYDSGDFDVVVFILIYVLRVAKINQTLRYNQI